VTPNPDLPAHDLGRVVDALERHGVEYLLIGGVAAIGYGATRQTEDADCVVRRTQANLDRVAAALKDVESLWARRYRGLG
jgi:hypothetical protein